MNVEQCQEAYNSPTNPSDEGHEIIIYEVYNKNTYFITQSRIARWMIWYDIS